MIETMIETVVEHVVIRPEPATVQVARRTRNHAREIIEGAGMDYDEHGGWGKSRGDYRSTTILDYVEPPRSIGSPFFDSGELGLVLITVERERRYSKSYHRHFGPSRATDTFLCGQNENGLFFAHAVRAARKVTEAVSWIWRGFENRILERQGDVAIVRGAGRNMILPAGHLIVEGHIVHETHPPIRMPDTGERLIVARRAVTYTTRETRD